MQEYSYHTFFQSRNGKQAGDPKKAAKAIYEITRESKPPVRLFLGIDAYQAAKEKGQHFIDVVEQTKNWTLATDLDPEEQKD
jgi:hypothetical protein